MSDVHATYEVIRQALMAGEEAWVEAVALRGGEWVIDWGVVERPTLRATPGLARLMADQFRASGWDNIAAMLVEAANFCDRHGPKAH